MDTPTAAPESKGPMIGIIIIVLILVLGSLYAISKNRTNDLKMGDDSVATTTETEPASIDDIEKDIQSSNTNSIESDFANLETEINAQ